MDPPLLVMDVTGKSSEPAALRLLGMREPPPGSQLWGLCDLAADASSCVAAAALTASSNTKQALLLRLAACADAPYRDPAERLLTGVADILRTQGVVRLLVSGAAAVLLPPDTTGLLRTAEGLEIAL